VPLIAALAVVLGAWFLADRWKGSKGPAAVGKLRPVLGWVGKGLAVVLGIAAFTALIQGCDGEDPSDQPFQTCSSYDVEDCPPEGGVVPTTAGAGVSDAGEDGGPRREPCAAYDDDDCPLAPEATTVPQADDGTGVPRQLCPAYDIEDCPPA
jgi:hypothetical protein